MADYNSYPTMMQSSQAEYANSDSIDANSNQISNNANNNIIYNSSPLIVLNSQKSDMAMLQNSMMNDGQTYVTIQTQPGNGTSDLNGAKLINTPIIIQNSQLPLQTSQYQQQQSQQQNSSQMASLTPSQLQSLSYLMQTQIAPQFIQTANGLIQIIPQGFITTQQQPNQAHDHEHGLQAQINGLPALGWSLGNFGSNNNNSNTIALDNQLQPLHMNNLSLPQLIPVQHVLQAGNSFFGSGGTQGCEDHEQLVTSIVDLNAVADNGKKPGANGHRGKPPRSRKRKAASPQQHQQHQYHPSSTDDVTREAAESSGIKLEESTGTNHHSVDNKGRPFSFLCPDCPKRFTLNSRLSAHMRCHTGMRPFTCTVCGFSFTQKSYLIRHAAVHKEERPFHCEKCQKSYKHYGSLANHRKLHRKEVDAVPGDFLAISSTTTTTTVLNQQQQQMGYGGGEQQQEERLRLANVFFQDQSQGRQLDGGGGFEEMVDEDEEDDDDDDGGNAPLTTD